MKLLLFVTGRGIGGDAVIAHTISEALNERNISTKIVLDSKAQGYYYKNKNISTKKFKILDIEKTISEYESGQDTSIGSSVYNNLNIQLQKIRSILGNEIN